MIEVGSLDRVVKETLAALESGKEAIYDIAENAREEVEQVKQRLRAIHLQTLETIQQVDRLTGLKRRHDCA